MGKIQTINTKLPTAVTAKLLPSLCSIWDSKTIYDNVPKVKCTTVKYCVILSHTSVQGI